MDSMLKPKLPDDPHDILMVAPDAVRVAPEEASDPIRDMMRDRASKPHIHVGSDFTAGAAVPPVDTTFRATAVGDGRRSFGSRALRAFTALLLTACIGGAAVAWQHHGDAAQRLIAEWAPLFARSTSQPSEKTGLSVQPTLAAAQVDTASSPQPAPQPQAATEAAAPAAAAPTAAAPPDQGPPDQAPSLEAMARDLANAGQEIAVLKATVEQLKASQQQLVAMVSEKNSAQAVRPKKPAQPVQPAPPPRPVAALAPSRRPMPPSSLPPRQAIAAQPLQMQTTPAPYAPRQAAPLPPTTAESLDDPELPYVPRPPMPLR
jgi:pyruvate/2-oxoglutarate dehydrogenase complex dihydrolipoamide acyltransferase (E2) component